MLIKGHRGSLGGLFGLVFLVVACGGTGPQPGPSPSQTNAATATAVASSSAPSPSPTPSPTPSPSPSPKKTPFVWQLVSNGSADFVQVTGAPVGSVCTPKAFLRSSGNDISGPGLMPKQVTDAAHGVSWSTQPAQPLVVVPSPPPAQGQGAAYFKITCTDDSLDPASGTTILDFTIS